ncbi:MAG: hypothetical protein HY355_00145 [Armatimonadetes bacterium]|nr:hypothetical protein [Armatimonadota bacterium]
MARGLLRRVAREESGIALLVVLLLMLAVGASSASFIWYMDQQQSRAGARYRAAAALAAAEAGVYRGLAILESTTPDGHSPGRSWRPTAHRERLPGGPLERAFTVSLADEPGGGIDIISTGKAGGARRRLRARVYLASPALLAALHGASVVRLENPPAATFILPYGAGIGDRPWVHIAAARGIWFATTDVSINEPSATFDAGPGPVDASAGPAANGALRPGPVRFLLARDADLLVGQNQEPVDVEQLRALGISVEGVVLRAEAIPSLPEVDQAYYRARAAANEANAALNEAAGAYAGDADLAHKRDSVYSAREFRQIQTYLKAGPQPRPLRGVVLVTAGLLLEEGERLQIAEGALVADGTVHLRQGALLEITHSAGTRTLPGLLVLDGALLVTEGARLRAHGLVYASRVIDVGQDGHVDVVGAVLGADRGLSLRNYAATVIIRYDPAVLGTPGLHAPAGQPVVAWVATWEELP